MAAVTGTKAGRPTRAEIDLDALEQNARIVKSCLGEATQMFAVVKADGYGHGAAQIAARLSASGLVAGFAVSLVEEGLELRAHGAARVDRPDASRPGEAGPRASAPSAWVDGTDATRPGRPIWVMGGAYFGAHEEMVAHDLVPWVWDLADIDQLARAARRLGKQARVHVKVDTGMSRLGLAPGAVPAFLQRLDAYEGVLAEGLCTHFAWADHPACVAEFRAQLARFEKVLAGLPAGRRAPTVIHAANSAATLRYPGSHFDAVRVGLALYGGGDFPEHALAPVMRLLSHVVQVKSIPAGQTVSYGGLWRAPRDSRLATVPVGYADGYARRLSGSDEAPGPDVLIGANRYSVVGAVCMDMLLVDVTEPSARGLQFSPAAPVAVGDEVVLLGRGIGDTIGAGELARIAGTIDYEILCGVSKRVPRVYLAGRETRKTP